jgi:hypothetical protein
MEKNFLSYLLPSALLSHFELRSVRELGDLSSRKMVFELDLYERNNLPPGYASSDYESKGFLSPVRVQDFPIRGKAVYLIIHRRRWRHKESRKTIKSDYSFIAQGAKLTRELADFLKGRGRVS